MGRTRRPLGDVVGAAPIVCVCAYFHLEPVFGHHGVLVAAWLRLQEEEMRRAAEERQCAYL